MRRRCVRDADRNKTATEEDARSLRWNYDTFGSAPTVNSIISEIEHKIFEITNRTLMLAFGDQWFELRVPIKIREKCHLRKDLEASGFPVASYLDFADYRAIWKFNWENFLPYLRLAHADPSRSKSLEFIQQILPIRNLASHTTKRIALGLTRPTIDQVKVLEVARDQLRQMLK